MQKIVVLPGDSEYLEYFGSGADFWTKPFLSPDDILASGTWAYDTSAQLQLTARKLVPSILFFLDGRILCTTENTTCRLWFGDPVTQEDLAGHKTCGLLAARTLSKERIRQDTPYEFIGCCTDKKNSQYTEFLLVYAARIKKKQLLKHEFLASLNDIPMFYYRLDPLSRKLFDVFYETPDLHRRYFTGRIFSIFSV